MAHTYEQMHAYTHTYTHTHIHTYTHTDIHAHHLSAKAHVAGVTYVATHI